MSLLCCIIEICQSENAFLILIIGLTMLFFYALAKRGDASDRNASVMTTLLATFASLTSWWSNDPMLPVFLATFIANLGRTVQVSAALPPSDDGLERVPNLGAFQGHGGPKKIQNKDDSSLLLQRFNRLFG